MKKTILLLLLVAAVSVQAQVYTPKITVEHLPDYTELGAFVNFYKWRDLPPQEKAVAIWQFLCDETTGLYPVQGIYEDPDPGPEYSFFDERDVLKVLNVHGHGYCGLLSPTLDGVYAAAGFSDSRIFNMRENHHCITEVYYDDGWHYFDMDLRGMLYKKDGTVANIKEAQTMKELWTEPSRPIEPFYPEDDKELMFQSFEQCFLTPMYHWYKNGHAMDFVLRPGESLTRYWYPQGDRWFHPWPAAGGFNTEFLSKRFEMEPRGLRSKHPHWSKWTHGNALFNYNPNLTKDYEDFERGVYDFDGVEQSARGLEATVTGKDKAHVIFEVRSPYIFVGRVYELDRSEKIDGASLVYYRSLGPLKISISTDNGLTWQNVSWADQSGADMVDLTKWIKRKYGYLLRFDIPAGSGLAELDIASWGQVTPISLPRLKDGTTKLTFTTGDRYGYNTTVEEIRLNLRHPDELLDLGAKINGSYEPLRNTAKIKGELIFKMDAKPGAKIKWFTAGGYFNTYSGKKARKDKNAIYYSTSGPEGPWKPVVTSDVPDWVLHWHYGMDEDIVLDQPAESVYFKYIGDPGLNQVWVYGHCLGREVDNSAAVEITYGVEENGEMKEVTNSFADKAEFTIDSGNEPDSKYFRLSLPSKPAR